jgi:hypothetical protein
MPSKHEAVRFVSSFCQLSGGIRHGIPLRLKPRHASEPPVSLALGELRGFRIAHGWVRLADPYRAQEGAGRQKDVQDGKLRKHARTSRPDRGRSRRMRQLLLEIAGRHVPPLIQRLEERKRPGLSPRPFVFPKGRDQTKNCAPLAEIVDPLMKPASSEARNTTQRAISSGSPRRPAGICGMILEFSTSSGMARTISVPI